MLAGGRSERMGRPKAELEIDDETFLQRAVSTLSAGGCQEVVVVTGPSAELVPGPQPDGEVRAAAFGGAEQIDSLRSGIRALPADAEAAVVIPVDHPLVKPETVARLIEAFRDSGAPIVVPTHEGKGGHPVLFGEELFDELLEGDAPEGARSIVHAHASELLRLDVEDRGVLIDVDTPEDYDRYIGGG